MDRSAELSCHRMEFSTGFGVSGRDMCLLMYSIDVYVVLCSYMCLGLTIVCSPLAMDFYVRL